MPCSPTATIREPARVASSSIEWVGSPQGCAGKTVSGAAVLPSVCAKLLTQTQHSAAQARRFLIIEKPLMLCPTCSVAQQTRRAHRLAAREPALKQDRERR